MENGDHCMSVETINKTIKIPNLMLIAGNGRNVGKTTLACQIIEYFSKSTPVVGVKISPHFHRHNNENVIYKNDNIIILEEKQINQKDSSLLLQSGAKKVYFIMVKPEHLKNEVTHIINILPKELIVCESGGLREFIHPGLFILVKKEGDKIVKKQYPKFSSVIVNNDGKDFDFELDRIAFSKGKININDKI